MDIQTRKTQSHRRPTAIGQAIFKLIMVGDSGTGKSSLLIRYVHNQFHEEHKVTIGVEFSSKIIPIDSNYQVKLQIWDTAGQQSFRAVVKSFYKNTHIVFLVYNISKRSTFDSLPKWLEEARENSPQNVMIALIGTHQDIQEREVQKEEAEKWIKDNQVDLFFETSSKSAHNVVMAFEEIANQMFLNQMNRRKSNAESLKNLSEKGNANVKLQPGEQKQKQQPKEKGCC